jgi:phosphoribosyl-AMP cyclohydrolase
MLMRKDMKTSEEQLDFTPKFDAQGLMPCVTTSAKTGKVLMVAYMNDLAIRKTIETSEAHYWSRSRDELWHKGASSGMVQRVVEMRTDCDQDCIWISVDMDEEASCHTGRESCFYRKMELGQSGKVTMKMVDDKRIFDPDEVY